eukprot:6191034-Pleurochrysis_carterae.AAC.1
MLCMFVDLKFEPRRARQNAARSTVTRTSYMRIRPDPMVVSNVDLLFKLPALSLSRARTYDALVFFAPKRVLVETKNAPPSLAAGTAELRPIVSMVRA